MPLLSATPRARQGDVTGEAQGDEVDLLADLGARLRSEGKRLGHARRRVLEALEAADGPVTAEDVAVQLPDVHVSSVYRSLNVLGELGLVEHTHLAHGAALYELSSSTPTVHLVCEVCGRDESVPAELFDPVRERLRDEHQFVLFANHFALVGQCTACAQASRLRRHDQDRGG